LIKAALLDIDGTLLDSVDVHARAWHQALAKFGHRVPFELVRHQIGKGGDQLVPVFLTRKQQQRYGKELEEYRNQLFKEKYLPQVKPFPKVRELVQCLERNGMHVVLASSAKGDELETYKRIAHIEDLVHKETSSDDASRSKPHPDIFAAALEHLHQVMPEEAVVVGDSPYDAQAAVKLGLPAIGVRCGGFPSLELQAAGFSTTYDDCADLLRHYGHSLLANRLTA
jgi:HAD superfamily hydrolase (TIGR01549 family)